jgi:hypothetical protein
MTFLILFLITPVQAHHPGGGGNTGSGGPINTSSASTLDEGQITTSARYEFIRLGELSDATLLVAASEGRHGHSMRSIESFSLSAAYGVTNDLTVAIRMPGVRRSGIREAAGDGHMGGIHMGGMQMGGMHTGGIHGGGMSATGINARGNSSGFGDVTLLGQYRFHKNPTAGTEAAVLFGVKAPTGSTDRRDRVGELFEAEFQPGSGSWDGLLGLALTKRVGPWSFDTSALYWMIGNGTQDTVLGDRLLFGAAVSYRLFGFVPPSSHGADLHAHCQQPENRHHDHCRDHAQHGHHEHQHGKRAPFTLDLVLELNGEWHDKQYVAGVADPNSGGTTVYLSPGVRVGVDRFSGFLSVGVPIVNQHNGLQSKPDYRVLTGISASLN